MVEFLTENKRRAYPLEHEWPTSYTVGETVVQVSGAWTRALLDACIGYHEESTATRVQLINVRREGSNAVFTIGLSQDDKIDVVVQTGKQQFCTVFASSDHYRVFLTIDGSAVDECVASITSGTTIPVLIPFSLRCVTYANKRVRRIEAYSPEICKKELFDPEECDPVKTITEGDVTIVAKSGVDTDVTTLAPITSQLLRISAIVAPEGTASTDNTVDMLIRGDDCFTVEAIPGARVVSPGVIEKLGQQEDPLSSGVIKIGTKCKPCCQCEDYKAAVDVLRPAEAATFTIEQLLNNARDRYIQAVAVYNAAKNAAKAQVNSYANIVANASAVTSGNAYIGSTSEGARCRIAINITIANMTMVTAVIRDVTSTVPGYDLLSVRWSMSGESQRSGESLSTTWTLHTGNTLSVVMLFAKTSTSSSADKPVGMSATYSAKIEGLPEASNIPIPVQ